MAPQTGRRTSGTPVAIAVVIVPPCIGACPLMASLTRRWRGMRRKLPIASRKRLVRLASEPVYVDAAGVFNLAQGRKRYKALSLVVTVCGQFGDGVCRLNGRRQWEQIVLLVRCCEFSTASLTGHREHSICRPMEFWCACPGRSSRMIVFTVDCGRMALP